MDMELIAEGVEDVDFFGSGGYNEDFSLCDSERCGICMDVVIDRGVLDCCQHWFCFPCIDNWATITNLCPLCQHEFQLITCVPVYDTIGSNKTEEDPCSSDNDWCIEGKNNNLSFPSYYIDENAVLCLDGDGCQIQSNSAALEEDPNLDTSIACDSCDIWYHAFCVGFDLEGTCENSWLCPRCVLNESPQEKDQHAAMKMTNHHVPEYINNSSEGSVGAVFSGKMMVSIADAGETAVVISMVQENKGSEESNKNLSTLEDGTVTIGKLAYDRSFKNPKLEESSRDQIAQEAHELELSLAGEVPPALSSYSILPTELDTNHADNKTCKHGLDKLLDGGPNHALDLCASLIVDSSSCGNVDLYNFHKEGNNVTEDQVAGDVLQQPSESCLLSVHGTLENIVGKSGSKRKEEECRSMKDGQSKSKAETKVSTKKIKLERASVPIHLKDHSTESSPDDSKKVQCAVARSKDDKLKCQNEMENSTATIMDIVRDSYPRPSKWSTSTNLDSAKKRENTAGLRVKKIMRRTEDKESSSLVQSLRKEIREAIHNRSSEKFEEELVNPKLLAAFRTAILGPASESQKSQTLVPRVKGALLRKGKVRENLTKKIYGISGRRRRAWTRDCEIEFWKGRCLQTMKPEKIETLRSVLDLLRKGSDSLEPTPTDEGTTSSILSRLYLADTSVFPRKDDEIKPLAAINERGEEIKKHVSNVCTLPLHNSILQSSQMKVSTSSGFLAHDGKGNENVTSKSREASSSKMHSSNSLNGPSVSRSGGSKINAQNGASGKPDAKTDKRKWALEVLARKMSITGSNAAEEKQEDNAVLKGTYPLLAQLPVDMRPVLAPCRHNKIPQSIRQVQLYRLTELFLRKANLPAICRTAETELAVVDAVNIEKQIAERSKTKLVYVNLCSQEVSHRSENKSVMATESTASASSTVSEAKSEEQNTNLLSDLEIDDALKNAGLLSDSPPTSPSHPNDESKDVDSEGIRQEEPDNVFEMDSHPELDIYGDFEYELNDDEFIGASALKVLELQHDGESKMKLVFSTSGPNNSNNALDIKEAIVDMPKVSSNLLELNNNTVNLGVDSCLARNSSLDGDEEPCLAECEELYGPDKEPLVKRFPERASIKPDALITTNTNPGKVEDHGYIHIGKASESESTNHLDNTNVAPSVDQPSSIEDRPKNSKVDSKQSVSDSCGSIRKKVEAYIKEHIRPLCKSSVITVEQYRWAVSKTTDKVMKYHSKDKNANFLIKEGEKVKKLAEQYVEAAPLSRKDH